MPLNKGSKGSIIYRSKIYLGQQPIQVIAISINSIPATMIVPPSAKPGHHHQHKPSFPKQPTAVYRLECPKCNKTTPPENLQIGVLGVVHL
jgi:hypothetical protein